MYHPKHELTLLATCCFCLAMATAASADFVGVTAVIKDDPDTTAMCTEGGGRSVPGPLTVCNLSVAFDDPTDRLLAVGNADLQVYAGATPDVFYQHPLNPADTSPPCDFIPPSPDIICDSFATIGVKCDDGSDATRLDPNWDSVQFNVYGHIVGGCSIANPLGGQGDAGTYPGLQVLFLQSSVATGLSMSGEVTVFWQDAESGDVIAEENLSVECATVCPAGEPCEDGVPCTDNDICNDEGGCAPGPLLDCDDGIPCTEDSCDSGSGCVNIPNDALCDDGNVCTDDYCDPDNGCANTPNNDPADDGNPCTENDMCVDGAPSGTPVQCPKGQVCDPAIGQCVQEHDPCECIDGKVTLCHVPPGNPDNAHTIEVGCRALDKHLAHGDYCGPCE